MTFFNSKEDVLEIELTQFGKYLISQGKWDPTYYSFFDDDILYDSQYAGYTELQNSIQPRITGSARTKTQYVFEGIETNIQRQVEVIRFKERTDSSFFMGPQKNKIEIQPSNERNYALSVPLGNSDLGNPNFPAWNITPLYGAISSSVGHSTSSLGVMPLVSLRAKDMSYITSIKNKNDEGTQAIELGNALNQVGESAPAAAPSDLILANRVYDDGSYVDIKEDYFLMEILEKNTLFQEENLEMEVFRVDTNADTGQETLFPLQFMKKKQLVVNDILIDDDDPELNQQYELTPDCVEYFFNVWVDDEIDQDTLCDAARQRRSQGLYAPPLDCPEALVPAVPGTDIYDECLPEDPDCPDGPTPCDPEPPCPGEENE